jgi:hypothetical protein
MKQGLVLDAFMAAANDLQTGRSKKPSVVTYE